MLEKAALDFISLVLEQRVLVAVTVCLTLLLFTLVSLVYGRVRTRRSNEREQALVNGLQSELQSAEQQCDHLQETLIEAKQDVLSLQEANSRLQVERAEIATRLTAEREVSAEKLALLSDAKKQLSQEFEVLAQRIFAEKQEAFTNSSTANLQASLAPFRDQLKEFRSRVDDVYDKESRDKSALRAELQQLKELNRQISEDAVNLTRALKSENKTQGNWGEVVLERVLEESGLHKGREYKTQLSFSEQDGKRKQPDVVIQLPEGKSIIIDAKVSLVAYERYCNAEKPEQQKDALEAHINSIRQHINGLSRKAYDNIEGLLSLDFVLIFIPIEGAFLTAFENCPELFHEAYNKNVVLVSPSTLLATLGTVRSLWRHERQNKNAAQIAAEAGALHDQFLLVLESLETLGGAIDKSQEAYNKAVDRLSRGRGNVLTKVRKLESLGAKTKKSVPSSIQHRADQNKHLLQEDTPNVG